MGAAAAALKVSESLVKNAKRMGCDAFNASGRVDEKKLLAFIAEHEKELTTGGVALRDQKLAEEVRKLKLRNDRDEGRLIQVESVNRTVAGVLARVDQILEQKLSNEYPSAVAGLDVPQARVYGKRLGDQLREEFQKLGAQW